MKDVCRDAVERAAGRSLTQAELADIQSRVARNQRTLASMDRDAYMGMSPEQRLQAAAKRAADELKAEAGKKKQRIALTIMAHDRINKYISDQKRQFGFSTLNSLKRLLVSSEDAKGNTQSLETRANATAEEYTRQLVDVFESIGPKAFGLFANKDGTRAFIHEVFGEDSRLLKNKDGEPLITPENAALAKQTAATWLKTTEDMRKRFNANGGDTGSRDDWHLPQNDSQEHILAVGQKQYVDDLLPLLDRKQYVRTDGSLMSDAEVRDVMNTVWETKASGGATKIQPGEGGGRSGMVANRHGESRVVHFKDADSYLGYQDKYGNKDPYDLMMSHVKSLSHDISTMETFGPNPDLQFKYWKEQGAKEATKELLSKAGKKQSLTDIAKQDGVLGAGKELLHRVKGGPSDNHIKTEQYHLQNLYDEVSGKAQPIASKWLAEKFDTLRNWNMATKLGSAIIPSIADNATMHLTAHYNRLSHTQLVINQLRALDPTNQEELRLARRAGLSLQTLMNSTNRYGVDQFGPRFSGKMSALTVRASGLNALTEARRRAFGTLMYSAIGHTVGETADLASVEKYDQNLMRSKGVTDQNFAVWKLAQTEDWGGGNDTVLTPQGIDNIPDADLAALGGHPADLRWDAKLKLMGMTREEIDNAVIEPGAETRAGIRGGVKGTWKGELMRSFFVFKSFPTAILTRHIQRSQAMGTAGGRAAYLGAFLASSTLLGGVAVQLSNLIAGRDPQDMTSAKFWISSLLKGGGLGIYGDFLFGANTSYGNTPLAIMSGPVISTVEDLVGLTQGSLVKMAQGEKTDFVPNLIKFVKNNTPLQNLWYTKAVTDRLFWNNLAEMASPGYMQRVQYNAQKTYNQQYWWGLGDAVPDRLPNPAAAVGN